MRFCFYLGYKDIKGGYTTLLLSLIKELSYQKQEVVLFNFPDGLIATELKQANIEIKIIDLNTIDWSTIDQQIFPEDIFIISKFLEVYKNLLKINPKFIYYDINDFICQISDYKFGIKLHFFSKKLLKKLLLKKSLLFMDDTGIFNLKKYFKINITDPVYLPIPVNIAEQNLFLKNKLIHPDKIRLTYIGRSVDWKMMPLQKILEDCAKIVPLKRKIIFSIVVDSSDNFNRFINLNDFHKLENFTIHVIENMLPSAISQFLLHESDLHFAMGTAALEAAKLGVPTILVDYSTKKFPNTYTYRWLYDTKAYNLGRNIEKITAEEGIAMENLLEIVSSNNETGNEVSKKSYDYVLNNHSADKVVSKLLSICTTADFRLKDARYLIPYYYKTHNFFKKTKCKFFSRKR